MLQMKPCIIQGSIKMKENYLSNSIQYLLRYYVFYVQTWLLRGLFDVFIHLRSPYKGNLMLPEGMVTRS